LHVSYELAKLGTMEPCLQDLDGHWWHSVEPLLSVSQGICTFSDCCTCPISLELGRMSINGWIAVELQCDIVKWEHHNGEKVEWRRARLSDFDGVWLNNKGSWCNVSAGMCRLDDVDVDHPILLQDGQLSFNGWVSTCLRTGEIKWAKGDENLDWRRLDVDDVAGIWRRRDGVWCNVRSGDCCFDDTKSRLQITKHEGTLLLNGWKLVEGHRRQVRWQRDLRNSQWDRPLPEDLHGTWCNAVDVKVRVDKGRCLFSPECDPVPLRVSGISLSMNKWRAVWIGADTVEWNDGAENLTWTRLKELQAGQKRKRDADCTVCLDNPVEIAFDPCGHVVSCQACAAAMPTCPVCRTTIDACLRIFL